MSSSSYWNNPFHFNSFIAKFDKAEEVFDLEEKNQNISMTMNTGLFNLSGEMQEIQEMQLPSNIKENEINLNINEPLNIFSSRKDIVGFEFDHSFLSFKKELPSYGYEFAKLSLKEKWVKIVRLGKITKKHGK